MKTQLLFTEAEAAERLRVCQRTLRKARQDGALHYVLIGRAVRYTLDDLESFIANLRQVRPECPQPSPTHRSAARSRRTGEIVPFTVRNASK